MPKPGLTRLFRLARQYEVEGLRVPSPPLLRRRPAGRRSRSAVGRRRPSALPLSVRLPLARPLLGFLCVTFPGHTKEGNKAGSGPRPDTGATTGGPATGERGGLHQGHDLRIVAEMGNKRTQLPQAFQRIPTGFHPGLIVKV